MGKFRPRISHEEFEVVKKYRAIKDSSVGLGLDPKTVHSGWLKTKEASLYFQNPDFGNSITLDDIRREFIKSVEDYSPQYPIIRREKLKKANLFTLNIADLHIGKLSTETGTGEKYDTNKAIETARKAVSALIESASGYKFDKVILTSGNDILHADASKASTTKGTPQDVSGMWHDNFVAARKLYVDVIEQLMELADVHVVHLPSNHDYASGFFLTDALSCWFNSSKNVTFDADMRHRKYFEYGKNLIGYTHGDGAKMEHLPLLMSNEAKEAWARTDFRYVYCGHIHHKEQWKFRSGKDYHGVTVEYMRSPSATDSWHHIAGYQHVKRAIEAFVHDKDNGQVCRLTQAV